MSLAVDQEILGVGQSLLKWLGVTSLTGFVGLYASWIAFPPELVIESVSDKSKKYNTESRFKLKNIGKLPALHIKCNVENLCMKVGNNVFSNCSAQGSSSQVIHRISGGESGEITVTPGIHFLTEDQIAEASYIFILEYEAKLFFLSKRFSKKWKIEVRNFEDGFSWNWMPII